MHLYNFTRSVWFIIAAILLAACVQEPGPLVALPTMLEPNPGAQSGDASAYHETSVAASASKAVPTFTLSTGSPSKGVSRPTSTDLLSQPFLQDTGTVEVYPGPQEGTPTYGSYPGPQTNTETPFPNPYVGPTTGPPALTGYPGPASPTVTTGAISPTPSQTPLGIISVTPVSGPTLTPVPGITASPTPGIARTPSVSGTPGQPPISTSQPPQNLFQTVTIWHSWSPAETQTLEEVVRSFQSIFPNVKFVLTYAPLDELQGKYDRAAYLGNGPSLLLGPADWGPQYYDKGLIADLASTADAQFLATINPAALNEARYHGALIGLPYAIRSGVVMYRNKTILPKAPANFDELISMSKAVTHGGTVGAYLEWSFYYSVANLDGMGGQLMDQNGDPTFNNSMGVEWLKLINAYKQAGPVEFNGNRDLEAFKSNKAGIIIDGTWNKTQLAQAIGAQNLAIDLWPAYKYGHLSGYLQTDNIYLNANISGDQRYAALQFMGFFLAPEVQSIMTRAGHIPAVTDVKVDDPLMQQEIDAFRGAVAYPILPEINAYWDPLQTAMRSVVNSSLDPVIALQQAFLDTEAGINSIRTGH
jgi:arabinogalactan oligomer/maltooligosaccharide transport system substrate-binding protein